MNAQIRRYAFLFRVYLHVGLLLTVAATTLCAAPANQPDRVIERDRSGQQIERLGVILRYDSKELQIQLPSGATRRIPHQRVVSLQAARSATHLAADKLFRQGQYREATSQYLQAYRGAKRNWVRHQLVADTIVCRQLAGERLSAAKSFLSLYQTAPDTRHFGAIPLAWRPRQADRAFAVQCARWLQSSDPAAQLIGASWLLAGQQGAHADRVLQQLSGDSTEWIRQLASMQRWRKQLATATPQQAARWQDQFRRSMAPTRQGPALLLGQVLQRHGEIDDAVMVYLQGAWSDGGRRDLAAASLNAAGQLLDQSNRSREALTLFKEVVQHHPDSEWAELAQERIEQQPDG